MGYNGNKMTEKLYKIVTLRRFHGLRFTHVPNKKVIDLIVREICGSKRYRELSLAVIGSNSDDDIYPLTCEHQLTLEEGIVFGVYYDGQPVGSGKDGARVRAYVASPLDFPWDLGSYEQDVRHPEILVPSEQLFKKSDYSLLRDWFASRGQPLP